MSAVQQATAMFKAAGWVPTDWVARWVMSSDLTDSTGNFNLTNTSVTFTGSVWVFNGSARGVHTTFLDSGYNAWSMSCWVKTSMSGTRGFIISKEGGGGGTVNYPFELHISTANKAVLYLNCVVDWSLNIFTGTTSINTGAWFNVIMTWDNTGNASIKMYIGGTADWSLTTSGHDSGIIGASTTYDYTIGQRGDVSEWFTGSLQKVTFYNRVVTSAEITALSTESIMPAWASGGAMATARRNLWGAGTTGAALSFGGYTSTNVTTTETYNWTSWASGWALATAKRDLWGVGTNTAALAFGGYTTTYVSTTESYNWSSWSSGGSLVTARSGLAGAGTNTAALSFGGYNGGLLSTTESYNWSSWSSGWALATARQVSWGAGTNTAALAFGGATAFPTVVTTTESYNWSSWSSGGALGTAIFGNAGAGTNTAALSFGGTTDFANDRVTTESYNWSSWSVTDSLATGRFYPGGCGSNTSALAFWGKQTVTATTEKFS